jgi:hypothetical protein
MRLQLLSLGVPSALALLVGCSAPVAASSEAADAEATSPAAAIVVVERTSGPGDGTRAEAIARFVQMRTGVVDEQALRMIGAAVDFPALGACTQVGRGWGDAPARAVKLADVGGVSLEASGVKTTLAARQLPDVADLVSGVVYTGRGENALFPQVRYTLRSTGTAEVDAFEVNATAPAEPWDVRVAGQDGRAPVLLPQGGAAAVDLSWEAGAIDDLVYVDVASKDAGTPVTRCLFADAGRAALPSASFGTIDEGTISVHRLHREAFRARGLDSGEVRFDFARAIGFTRR